MIDDGINRGFDEGAAGPSRPPLQAEEAEAESEGKAGRLRWIVPVAYVAVADSLALPLVVDGSGQLTDAVLPAQISCIAALLVANLVQCAVMHARKAPLRRAFSRRAMLLVKLGLVPFYCLGALLVAYSALIALHPVLFLAGMLLVPLLIACGWLAMMGGSAWAIAYAVGLCRDGRISVVECVVHVISQLVLVADVVSAVVLFARGRKLKDGEGPRGGFDAMEEGAAAGQDGSAT